MKRFVVQVDGDRVRLQADEAPVPQAGPGQLLVKMAAAALNRGEFIPGGLVKGGAAKPAGMEGAGEVVAVGAGVSAPAIGTVVMGRCNGAFAEYALMDAREAMPVPPGMPLEQAAALPLTGMVVHDMLVTQGGLAPGVAAGKWLLIAGVSSGVGVTALQCAKALGVQVIGTSGSEHKLDVLRGHGLDLGIATRTPDFAAQVLEATGGAGVNLVINAVGGTVFAECLRCLAFEGRLATVGYVDHSMTAPIDLALLHLKRLVVFGVSNKLRSPDQKAAGVPAFVADLMPAVADGRIRPLVDRVFPLAEALAAQAHMEANQHLGKIVLRIAA